MSLFLLLHYTSVNYSTHTKFHYTKAPAKTAPSYFPLHPLQSVVPIITLYLYIILVNTKHQSSKKPSRSLKPHKASILGLFVILFMYFMYFNFIIFHLSHYSTNTHYLLQAFHYAILQPLQYYTSVVPITALYICILYSYRSTIIYYTTSLYNSLLFQLLNYYYTMVYCFNYSIITIQTTTIHYILLQEYNSLESNSLQYLYSCKYSAFL